MPKHLRRRQGAGQIVNSQKSGASAHALQEMPRENSPSSIPNPTEFPASSELKSLDSELKSLDKILGSKLEVLETIEIYNLFYGN
jgi:hypothetical protein